MTASFKGAPYGQHSALVLSGPKTADQRIEMAVDPTPMCRSFVSLARPRPGPVCQNSPRRFVCRHRRPSCPRPTSRAFGRLETEEPGPLDPVRASQRRFRVATNRRAEPRLQSSLAPDFSHVCEPPDAISRPARAYARFVFAANGADVSVTPLSTIRSRRRSVSSASTTPDRADATRRLDACLLLRQAEFSRQVVQLGGGARVGHQGFARRGECGDGFLRLL